MALVPDQWWVYFIRPVGQAGPVKIGVSHNPQRRLHTYSTWSPVPLELAAVMEGSPSLERRFHAHFLAQHSHHEWFHASAELDAMIAAINAGDFDTDALPRGVNLYFLPAALRRTEAA